MTDKPEIRGYEIVWPQVGLEPPAIDLWASQTFERTPPQFATSVNPLIRLTDHEASRAADKKRMAGLEAALRTAKELADFWINQSSKPGMTETEYSVWLALGHQSKAMDAIRVALAQQGKEGGA